MKDVPFPGSLARIHADRGQVEQVLLHLAVNARDAMPQGGNLVVQTRDIEVDTWVPKWLGLLVLSRVPEVKAQSEAAFDESPREAKSESFLSSLNLPCSKNEGIMLSRFDFASLAQNNKPPDCPAEYGTNTHLVRERSRNMRHAHPPLRSAYPVVEDDQDSAQTLALLLRFWGYEVAVANDGPDASIAVMTAPREDLLGGKVAP